jgi:2-oxoglutarate ferredoxin oxidoreductase subunit delta
MVNPEKCSGCDLCGMYCPDFAIFCFKNVVEKKDIAPAAAPL